MCAAKDMTRPVEKALHFGARLEDSIHSFREGRARRRGYVPAVLPFAGYGSTTWIRVLSRTLLANPNTNINDNDGKPQKGSLNVRGWRSFTSVPIANGDVTIRVGDQTHHVQADRGGVVDAVVPASLPPGRHVIRISVDNSAVVDAPVFIAPDNVEIGILSDIDDTVMVTALPRPLLAAWNTFVVNEHARMPTPGMAVLMERLTTRHRDAPTIYLSTGAWNVAPTLGRFLTRNMYPAGALLLTDWGPTRDRWFRSGREHKRGNLERLAQDFPNTRWVLIGDDGQHDPEIYAEFAQKHPGNVAAIAIRELSAGEAVLAGGRAHEERLRGLKDVHWVQAPDGAGLSSQLSALGLL